MSRGLQSQSKVNCDKCGGTGKLPMSDCCEDGFVTENVQGHILNYCQGCNDLCEMAICDKCNGEGKHDPERQQEDSRPQEGSVG